MELEIAKNIVFSTFEGKATSMQQQMIAEWLTESAHTELYFKWLEEWEKANPQFLPDEEKAYQTFISNTAFKIIENKFENSKKSNTKLFHINRFWASIAASIALILIIATGFFKEEIWFRTYQTAFGETQNITLPDNSKVILNANSRLQVPRFGFGNSTREVFLQGEAEFSVKHTIDHQNFLVKTPDKLVVEVLGTEFVVYTRQRGTKVALHKGKVQLHSLKENNKEKVLEMQVGEVVTIDKKGTFQVQKKQEIKMQGKAWQEHSFFFENTSLQDIAYQIEENFGINVQINDSTLAQRKISGEYQAANATELLQAIAQVLGVQVEKNNTELLITNQ
jgi:ferric-dicitrate binding protein FerR (iron transport regulator)